jgi:hypothetical protein
VSDIDESTPLVPSECVELLRVLERIVGKDAHDQFIAYMLSDGAVAEMGNPATFLQGGLERLTTLVNAQGGLPPTSDETMVALIAAIREMTRAMESDPQVLGSQMAKDVRDFFKEVASLAGLDSLLGAFKGTSDSTLWSPGAARALLSLYHVTGAPMSGPFESRVRQTIDAVGAVAERVYRPLLEVLIRIEYVRRRKPVPRDAMKVGKAIGTCLDLWKAAGPTSVLDNDIRVIRNAEAHHQDEIDVHRETITFIDRSKPGAPETRGPWAEERLRAYADGFLQRCGVIGLASLAFLVEEVCAVWEREGRVLAL